MKVPFRLHRLATNAPATALLVSDYDAEQLLRVVADLGLESWPKVFAVADGFVLHLSRPSETRLAGAIRLHAISEHLLVPVDGELVPPLLPDEAQALVQRRGLVFLPGDRVLEYDPVKPLSLPALLALPTPKATAWQTVPVAPVLAGELVEITLFRDDPSLDGIIEQGGTGIAENPLAPPNAGFGKQLLGGMLFALGEKLASMGQGTGFRSVAGIGAKLLGAAMSMAPGLAEKLFGAQDAMLKRLVQMFQDGKIEEALRHAMPIGDQPIRGESLAQHAQLPTNDLLYSLRSLLGPNIGGGASVFMSSDDTFNRLRREYQKQADLAVQRGDYRRAAFIYARLLTDFSSAARVLAKGGLHRDAAVIYEKKLFDLSAAAREWEAAGEYDRALDMFHQLGDHVSAGDLLRRIGEEERAIAEYQQAATKLRENGGRYFEAGELLRVRGQRPDLALMHFADGWRQRPANGALACATQLARHHAGTADADAFLGLISEAEDFVVSNDPDSTAKFFTEIARLGKTKPLASIADDVHDRALIAIARKVHECRQTTTHAVAALGGMFATGDVWSTPLVNDARHAIARTPARVPTKPQFHQIKVGSSTVTAVAASPTGMVFLGFQNGEVLAYTAATNGVQSVRSAGAPIVGIRAEFLAGHILVLSYDPSTTLKRLILCDGSFQTIGHVETPGSRRPYLGYSVENCGSNHVIIADENDCVIREVPSMIPFGQHPFDYSGIGVLAVVHGVLRLVSHPLIDFHWIVVFGFERSYISLSTKSQSIDLDLRPGFAWIQNLSTVHQSYIRVVQTGPMEIEIFTLDSIGSVVSIRIDIDKGKVSKHESYASPIERYRAFTCPRDGLIAGVHTQGVDWWTSPHGKPIHTKMRLQNPVAAFTLSDAREILIVEADGTLIRVPWPR